MTEIIHPTLIETRMTPGGELVLKFEGCVPGGYEVMA